MIIRARLGEELERMVQELRPRYDNNDSLIVRQAIRLLHHADTETVSALLRRVKEGEHGEIK